MTALQLLRFEHPIIFFTSLFVVLALLLPVLLLLAIKSGKYVKRHYPKFENGGLIAGISVIAAASLIVTGLLITSSYQASDYFKHPERFLKKTTLTYTHFNYKPKTSQNLSDKVGTLVIVDSQNHSTIFSNQKDVTADQKATVFHVHYTLKKPHVSYLQYRPKTNLNSAQRFIMQRLNQTPAVSIYQKLK